MPNEAELGREQFAGMKSPALITFEVGCALATSVEHAGRDHGLGHAGTREPS